MTAQRCCIALVLALAALPLNAAPYTGTYYTEPYRPLYHYSPEKAWMNDPNGLLFHNGKYHMFYQYHPASTVWGPMHWGHATSTDLTHWQEQPVALAPDALGWIFSGSAVVDENNTAGFGANAMVAVFTYHNDAIWKQGRKNTESQGLAYSLDDGRTWTKFSGNPVLDNSGEQDFRDPKVFWDAPRGRWTMALAVGDRIRFFASPDLKRWQALSDFHPAEDGTDLGVWECPDLFPLKTASGEEKWVLIVNHGDKAANGGSGTRYFVGDFDGTTFAASQPARWLDYGTDFYAGVTYNNAPGGQRILQAWMSNWQYATKTPTAPWRSAMTLPRALQMEAFGAEYRLRQTVAADVGALSSLQYRAVKPVLPLHRKNLDLGRAQILFNAKQAQHLRIELSNDVGERFTIYQQDGQLFTDRSASGNVGFSPSFAAKPQAMPLNGEGIEDMQLLLDRSSIEILVNGGRYSMTNQYFPSTPYSQLRISANQGETISYLRVMVVSRIWPYARPLKP